MPRLFTGLEIPQPSNMELSLLQGGLKGARWIDPKNYHITLKFIGDIDYSLADEVKFELRKVESDSIEVRFDGLGVFGGKKPHNIHANVELNSTLERLEEQQSRILERIGLKFERRKFIPHITLARLRGFRMEEVANWIGSKGKLSVQSFIASRFVLYSARESTGGGPYVVEVGYPFKN